MKTRTWADGNGAGPFCDPAKERCGNTEHAPGVTDKPSYSSARPFALETHFEPNEGNAEKHIAYPTSRLPLWFGGGHTGGGARGSEDDNGPWYCDTNSDNECGPSATDATWNEVDGEFGPYVAADRRFRGAAR